MSEITQYINLGIAGVALYLMYAMSIEVIRKTSKTIEANTAMIGELKLIVQRLCDVEERKR